MKKIINIYKNLNVAIKASIWFTICSIIQKGISVITMPIFTRIMSMEQYGQYNIFITWYNIILIIVTLNIHLEVFNKGLSEHSSNMDEFTTNQIGLLNFLIVIYIVIYLLFHRIFNNILNMSTLLMIVMLVEIWCNTIISFWRAHKRFEYSYKKIVLVSLICTVFSPIIGIVCVLNFRHKVEAKVISNIIIPCIVAIIIFIMYCKKNKMFDNFSWWRKTIILALPLLPHYLSLILLNQSDKLMINYFNGTESAAIYSVAHSAGFLMVIVNNSINNSFVPWCYSKLKNNDLSKFKLIVSTLVFLVLFINLFLIWVAPECISFFAPKEYHEAIWCLVPIAMSVFFSFVYSICVDIEVYYEKNKYVAIASIIATVLNIVLNYIFIPKYGFLAAGFTTLISYFVILLLHFVFLSIVTNCVNIRINQIFDIKSIILSIFLLILLSIFAVSIYNYAIVRVGLMILTIFIIIIFRKKIMDILLELKNK